MRRPSATPDLKSQDQVRSGRRPTIFFSFLASAFGHARPGFPKPGPMWPKEVIFFYIYFSLRRLISVRPPKSRCRFVRSSGTMAAHPPRSVFAFDLIVFRIPLIRRRHLMWPSATSDGIAGNSCWLNIMLARHYMPIFSNDVGLRPHRPEIVACNFSLFFPFLRRPSATPDLFFRKLGPMWPKADTFVFLRRPSATLDLVFQNQATDVAEGPHMFSYFYN